MNFEQKNGQFVMFRSKRMQSDAFPKYRGSGKDLSGNEFTASAWEVPNAADRFEYFDCRMGLDKSSPKQSDITEVGAFKLWSHESENPKAPSYRGKGIDLNGQPFRVAAWLRTGKYGQFLSCQMEEMRPAAQGSQKVAEQPKMIEPQPAQPAPQGFPSVTQHAIAEEVPF